MLEQLVHVEDTRTGFWECRQHFSVSHSARGALIAHKAMLAFHSTALRAVPDRPVSHIYTHTDGCARLQAGVAAEVQVGAHVAVGADHIPQHE